MLWGVTGRAGTVGEPMELLIGDEPNDADGKLSKVLVSSTATCAEVSIASWITPSNGIMCTL